MGSTLLSSNTYDAKGRLASTTYGNNTVLTFLYDELNRETGLLADGVLQYTKHYDGSSRLVELRDERTGTVYKYEYDILDRPVTERVIDGATHAVVATLTLKYDDTKNRLSGYDVTVNGTTTSYAYSYGENYAHPDAVTGLSVNGTRILDYEYDALGRLKVRTLGTATPFETEYTYLAGATAGTTTTLVSSVKNGDDTLAYTYDVRGNITSIRENGTLIESYTYDALGQLKTVTRGSDVWEYTYDNGGNILSVTKNGTTVKSYTYGNTEWKDLLTSYNGNSITYDNIGNPTTYHDGSTFTWSDGRKLTGITKGTNTYSYQYDANGYRTSKTVNGVTTQYYWLDGRLYQESNPSYTLRYKYDDKGSKIGFDYVTGTTSTSYYYVYNLQGDVIAIVDSNNTTVVEYTYNEWGKLTATTGTLAATIGVYNPIRYRGYYYDIETGFYLTGTRYYDPEIGRFINADNQISGVGSDIRGYSLFAYCFNNPVNMSDPTGNWPRWITAAVKIVATVVAVVAVATGNSALASVATNVSVAAGVTYMAQSAHYDVREARNDVATLPQSPSDATKAGWINSDPKSDLNPNGGGPAADCHQFTATNGPNVKYVSPDGHREVIYNSSGDIVLDSRDIGTYNFCPSDEFWYSDPSIGHLVHDIIPWVIFGNSDDDPGPIANYIICLFE